MKQAERERFDALMEEAVENLPPNLRQLLDEIPVIVLDRPTPAMLKSLEIDPGDKDAASEICGLHTGTAITEKSVERTDLPTDIHLFRAGILNLALGEDADRWEKREGETEEPEDYVYEEIMVTLLHEIGHHFGLDEDDLERLGYD